MLKIIGITGGSGSGKTTFAKKVLSLLPDREVAILSMDSYYLQTLPEVHFTKNGKPNFDHPFCF